jgi:hypothetical protein
LQLNPPLSGMIDNLRLQTSSNEVSVTDNEKHKKEMTVKQYFEHFNNHEWQKMADMYVDEAEFKDPSVGIESFTMTKSEIVAKYSELGEIFPDLKNNVIETYLSGDKNIIVEFVTRLTIQKWNCLSAQFLQLRMIK